MTQTQWSPIALAERLERAQHAILAAVPGGTWQDSPIEGDTMQTTQEQERGARSIAQLNDNARRALGVGCKLVQTEGICAQSPAWQSRVRELVETFDKFTPANDPHGEHDFGAIVHEGVRAFWKIDYFDRALEYGSEDPADPRVTRRVLTIMLAEEY